jgi:hypothetical protein
MRRPVSTTAALQFGSPVARRNQGPVQQGVCEMIASVHAEAAADLSAVTRGCVQASVAQHGAAMLAARASNKALRPSTPHFEDCEIRPEGAAAKLASGIRQLTLRIAQYVRWVR